MHMSHESCHQYACRYTYEALGKHSANTLTWFFKVYISTHTGMYFLHVMDFETDNEISRVASISRIKSFIDCLDVYGCEFTLAEIIQNCMLPITDNRISSYLCTHNIG